MQGKKLDPDMQGMAALVQVCYVTQSPGVCVTSRSCDQTQWATAAGVGPQMTRQEVPNQDE